MFVSNTVEVVEPDVNFLQVLAYMSKVRIALLHRSGSRVIHIGVGAPVQKSSKSGGSGS